MQQYKYNVDLTKLNESVQRNEREHLFLPSVKHTLVQINGAKYFSKLECKFGILANPALHLNHQSSQL